MSYYTGSLIPVPVANRDDYVAHARASWPILRDHGALRMVETWGVDIPRGKVNDLYGAVESRDGENVVFSWIEWADKAACDEAWKRMEQSEAMKAMPPMPFDGARMIYGGFEPVVAVGNDRGAGYIQGFALAVPEKNRQAYVDMANDAWNGAFGNKGALGMVEAWGIDVPHGKRTDFYRATLAEEGEVPLFSWVAWPDKATCDAAARAMEAEWQGKEMPQMPFDGRRMMWGGFEPVFDSAA